MGALCCLETESLITGLLGFHLIKEFTRLVAGLEKIADLLKGRSGEGIILATLGHYRHQQWPVACYITRYFWANFSWSKITPKGEIKKWII